jgi:hypothetical protein
MVQSAQYYDSSTASMDAYTLSANNHANSTYAFARTEECLDTNTDYDGATMGAEGYTVAFSPQGSSSEYSTAVQQLNAPDYTLAYLQSGRGANSAYQMADKKQESAYDFAGIDGINDANTDYDVSTLGGSDPASTKSAYTLAGTSTTDPDYQVAKAPADPRRSAGYDLAFQQLNSPDYQASTPSPDADYQLASETQTDTKYQLASPQESDGYLGFDAEDE